ncbi:hypothetical protein HDU93_000133 [Gonapodya sp. JEL0774]|nr:hypothetical protein HDU93_000133 [Gonapodya sp. JEL0774]
MPSLPFVSIGVRFSSGIVSKARPHGVDITPGSSAALSHASRRPFSSFKTSLISSGPQVARALLFAALFSKSVPLHILSQARLLLLRDILDEFAYEGPESATDLWNLTRAKGLPADPDSLALLCAALFESLRWQEALMLWTATVRNGDVIAEELGVPFGNDVEDDVLDGLGTQPPVAEDLVATETWNVEIDKYLVRLLAEGLIRATRPDEVVKLFGVVQREPFGMDMDVEDFTLLLSALSLVPEPNPAHPTPASVLESLHTRGLSPTPSFWASLLSVHLRQNQPGLALSVLETHVASDPSLNPELPSTARVWNTVVAGFAQAGDIPGALDVVDKMRERKCPPDAVTVRVVIDAAAARRPRDPATVAWCWERAALEEGTTGALAVRLESPRDDRYVRLVLASVAASAGQDAASEVKRVWGSLGDAGYSLDESCRVAYTEALLTAGDTRAAADAVRAMAALGIDARDGWLEQAGPDLGSGSVGALDSDADFPSIPAVEHVVARVVSKLVGEGNVDEADRVISVVREYMPGVFELVGSNVEGVLRGKATKGGS